MFYIATGRDAVFLNKQLQLKCICFTEGVCKIGIPEKRLEYYLKKLEKLNLAYIVYHFDNEHEELIEEEINEGEYHKEKSCNKNCLICKGIRYYKEDKYMNALSKLFEREAKENAKNG